MPLGVAIAVADAPPTYWYEGVCPQRGEVLRLPRTALAEAIAHQLQQQLRRDARYNQEGKMYGILLVETATGDCGVLKAFSGLLQGCGAVAGWVPPIPGRDRIALAEAQTLDQLNAIRDELLTLQHSSVDQKYHNLASHWEKVLQDLASIQNHDKHHRQQQRQHLLQTLTGTDLETALNALDEASRQAGLKRKYRKRDRDQQLAPLKQQMELRDRQIQALKQRRKRLSQQLQAQMHRTYCLTNFAGESLSLADVLALETSDGALPTGSGDCCAPKLLHYAASHGLKPLAMAEFWWGPAPGDKIPGAFYGACAERCQPLMGFLLSGQTGPPLELPIVYEDAFLIVVNKPAGLLSVPGRTGDRYDSVLARLRRDRDAPILPVHRLDQATSGLLLLAKDTPTQRDLCQQFQQCQIKKIYEAILAGPIARPSNHGDSGTINLPLWGDPKNRPYQTVDWQQGKPSITQFRLLTPLENTARIELMPVTGRTHQLRVHAADPQGLGVGILGDRLYGSSLYGSSPASRLHLHARELHCTHPLSGQLLHFHAATPF